MSVVQMDPTLPRTWIKNIQFRVNSTIFFDVFQAEIMSIYSWKQNQRFVTFAVIYFRFQTRVNFRTSKRRREKVILLTVGTRFQCFFCSIAESNELHVLERCCNTSEHADLRLDIRSEKRTCMYGYTYAYKFGIKKLSQVHTHKSLENRVPVGR